MASRMKKGLLKPIRYLSHMFDGKERELQIGYPTDVEHVAHIGWDGPEVNGPSWMREFHSAPLSATSFGEEGREKPITNLWASQEIHPHGRLEDDSIQETPRYDTVEFDSCSPPSIRTRRSRRHRPNVITVGDRGPSEETSVVGKRSHRRRSKGSQESGTSNRRSRLKDSTSCHGESECCIRANPSAEANRPSE